MHLWKKLNSSVGTIHLIHKFPHQCEQLHERKKNKSKFIYLYNYNTTDKDSWGEVSILINPSPIEERKLGVSGGLCPGPCPSV